MILQEAASLSLNECMQEAIEGKTWGVVMRSTKGAPALAVLSRGDETIYFEIIQHYESVHKKNSAPPQEPRWLTHAVFVQTHYGKLDPQTVADSSYHPTTGERMTTDEVDAMTQTVLDADVDLPNMDSSTRGFTQSEMPLWPTVLRSMHVDPVREPDRRDRCVRF